MKKSVSQFDLFLIFDNSIDNISCTFTFLKYQKLFSFFLAKIIRFTCDFPETAAETTGEKSANPLLFKKYCCDSSLKGPFTYLDNLRVK